MVKLGGQDREIRHSMVLSDYTGQEDMKKARFYAGLIHLLDFLGWYKIIKWGGVNRTILSRALFKPIS